MLKAFYHFCQLLSTFPTTLPQIYKLFTTSDQIFMIYHFYTNFLPLKIASILFFSSSDKHLSHHLVRCHTTGINFLFISLSYVSPSHKPEMNNSFKIVFIKISIIKINFIKIYTRNIHFIAKNCGVVKTFFDKDYINIRKQRIIKFSNHLTCKKPIRMLLENNNCINTSIVS